MYDTNKIAEKVKSCAKSRGIRLGIMLKDLGLGVNAISQLSAGSGMSYLDFAKVADYLSVSVDYLLDRDSFSSSGPADEQKLIAQYRELDADQKKAICKLANDLAKLARLEDNEAFSKESAS